MDFLLIFFYVGILGVHVIYISFGIKLSDLLELLYNHHGLKRAPVYSKCFFGPGTPKNQAVFVPRMDGNGKKQPGNPGNSAGDLFKGWLLIM